jgi:hypothetical protein
MSPPEPMEPITPAPAAAAPAPAAVAPAPAPPAEDWERELAGLEARLREWRRRRDAELHEIRKERGLERWFRRPRPEELREAEQEARRRAGTDLLGELSKFLDGLCDLYPKSLPQERAKIRARIGGAEAVFELFWPYVEGFPGRIRAPGDAPEVLRGLVALAIDDMRAELGLVEAALGRMLVAAEGAGIDWRPALAQAASVANKGAGGGGACMRELLEEFPTSSYFRSTVAPALREAARSALTLPR